MSASPQRKFFISGGTMPVDSASYVERASDVALFDGLVAGRYCYVLNSRQMGKSSLSVRVIDKLDRAGVRTALVDLTRIGGRNVNPTQWYAGLCDSIGNSLGLRSEMLDFYRHHAPFSPMQRFFAAIENVALATIPNPIAIFIDEIDTTRNLAFEADEFFAGIRECYNRRAQNPEFNRLSFCLIGVAVPTDLISNPVTTPFNIGDRIQLNDFTLAEMESLAGPLGEHGPKLIERIHYWTGGQPFLSQSLCEAVLADSSVQTATDVDALVQSRLLDARARSTNINLSDVAERVLNATSGEVDPDRFRAALLTSYERAWRGGRVPDDEANRVVVILKLSGLMRSDGSRLEVRNRIYREVFNQKWVEDNFPERELLRERQAFRRGLVRAASASALVVGIVCALGLFAWSSERRAASAGNALNYELYVADMNNMRLLEEIGDISRMDEILDRTRNSPYRGFEWSFWLSRIHESKEEYTLDYSAQGKREFGFLSQDGKEICVYDSLVGFAAIIERSTRRTLAFRELGRQARIVATRAGFVTVKYDGESTEATDIRTGKVLSRFQYGQHGAAPPLTRTTSDYALVLLKDASGAAPHELVMWDLVTGKVRYRHNSDRAIPSFQPLLVAFNQAGTRVAYCTVGVPPGKGPGAYWYVRNVDTDAVVDAFVLPPRANFDELSASGKLVSYDTIDHTKILIDVDQHREVFRQKWDGGDLSVGECITADDSAIAEYFGNGLASLVQLRDGRVTPLGQHVWHLESTNSPESLLASSTSVRLLDRSGAHLATTIGVGPRLARDQRGNISVITENPPGIYRYSDPEFRLISHPRTPARMRGFTYNGLWRLAPQPDGRSGLFIDVEAKMPGLSISPMPANYSCGNSPESLVTLERFAHRLTGRSGTTGRVRWTYNVTGEAITGLWVSPDGAVVLALSGDVQLLALDGNTGKLLKTLGGHNVRIANLTFTRDGSGFFTCGADGRVILWDMKALEPIQQFRGNVAQRMSSADLSPDKSRVVSCNYSGSWQLWDVKTGVEMMDIHGSPLPLRSIMFSADGMSVLTSGDDMSIRRWMARSQDPSVRIEIAPRLLTDIKR